MSCTFNYIEKQNISESEKSRLNEVHVQIFQDAVDSKAFRKFNNKLYTLKNNIQAAYNFVSSTNKKLGAKVASIKTSQPGQHFLSVNTLPLSKELQGVLFNEVEEMLEDIKNEPISKYKELGSKQDIKEFKSFIKTPQQFNLREQPNTLFGLNTQNQGQLEFHINTLNVVSKFLENVGVEQRLVSEFLSQDGNVVEGAIAAANFVKGTVDIIEDLNKGRAEAWNKLPEEAAHWWYRLLNENSPLKKALWESHQTALKNDELYAGQYGKLVKSPSDLTEESIGQLIAEAIKRIETKNGSAADYSFFKKFLEWINSIIDIFKNTTQDPFEVAAIKILSSDKAKQVFDKGKKNNWSLDKILTELQIPKEQKQLILDLGKTNIDEIITDLLANYSYTIEINTAKDKIIEGGYISTLGSKVSSMENRYGKYYYTDERGVEIQINKTDWETAKQIFDEFQKGNNKGVPTQYYSNLTVPGGTNYTENEIATPAITPSIKGHAQFATDNGLMWSRTDERVQYQESETDKLLKIMENSGVLKIKCS